MASKCDNKSLGSSQAFDNLPTPERLKELARIELGETESLKEECLRKLKILIKDHNVACISTDDLFLLRFLRCQEFHVQKTLETLRKYASFRVSIHEKLPKLTPDIIKTCCDVKFLGFLPNRDADDRVFPFFRPAKWNKDICSFDEIQTVAVLFSDYLTENELVQVNGLFGIYDTTDVPFSYVIYFTPYITFWMNFLLECLPARYKVVYFILRSMVAKVILPLLTPFIPKKLLEKFRIHERQDQLLQYFVPQFLPEEFGGTLGPLNNDRLSDALVQHLQKMKDEQRYFFP